MSKVALRVCDSSPSSTLDITSACQPLPVTRNAPIDNYYDAAESITLVGTQNLLTQYDVLGRLLLLGHVGATEAYLREILVGLLNLCPLSRAHAGSQNISFSSVLYYSQEEVAHGLFDGTSLAGGTEVGRAVLKLTGIQIATDPAISAILPRFDQLCHLRHAAVHAHGRVGSGNAAVLGLAPKSGRLGLNIDMARVHESAMICRGLVQELNQVLFLRTFYRWRDAGVIIRDYRSDRAIFGKLFGLFRSTRDQTSGILSAKRTYDELLI